MTINITPEQMEGYKRGARERLAREANARERRREVAWSVAREAARILKEEFGATRVVAFGSLAHGHWFRLRSDIDLAVEGVAPRVFWRAWAALDRLGHELEIDLIDIESASERLRESIAREGVEL